ncbi:alkaline phosphatase D family protein [bacterium]|nr:alkaline phosphatase D family protein [bacterium]
MNRRRFLKSLGVGLAAVTTTGCGETSSSGAPAEPVDFPLGLDLPFAHGVASGDPLADRVILWTRVTVAEPGDAPIPVRWTVARDPGMRDVVASGTQEAIAARDWTVKVDAVGLEPATTYYYRFEALGARSIVGRTRTAPAGAVDNLRFAVVSCSSLWSSYWSGYAHLAARDDLDLVIHCGDYIYDFPDQDELIRSRNGIFDTAHPDFRDWLDLGELRRRYALWRSDPNLLAAHQQHPWFIVWDNHDIDEDYGNELDTPYDDQKSTTTLAQTTQAFWEWTPSRPPRGDGSGEFLLVEDGSYPEPPDSLLVWRRLPYGDLADVFGVDTQIGRPGHGLTLDAGHLPDGTPTLYGRGQFEWLTGGLRESQRGGVAWRVVNNQAWFAPADIDAAGLKPLGISRWSSYAGERAALCRELRGGGSDPLRVRGTIFVSGDSHGNFASDVVESAKLLPDYSPGAAVRNPADGTTPENVQAGFVRATTGNTPELDARAASVGVEFAPSSMGRGGADETVKRGNASSTFAQQVAGARSLEAPLIGLNPNMQFLEWVEHGYGIVDLTPERAIFEYWWQDKLVPDSPDVLGLQAVTWAREDAGASPAPRYRDQVDPVALHGLATEATRGTRRSEPAPGFVGRPR